MEHTKLIKFTIKCSKCTRAWSITKEDLKSQSVMCHDIQCKNEFSVYEGMKNGLKCDDRIVTNPFLANDIFNQTIDIKIGHSVFVDLPNIINKVYMVKLFPLGSFIAGATDVTSKGFRIFSSLPDNGDSGLFGKEAQIMMMVHTKTDDYEVPWLHFLAYAFDQYIAEEYLTSIMLAEIALEAYVDNTLAVGYRKIGLDSDSISRFLEISNMPIKVNVLMNNIFNVKLASSPYFKIWENKVLKWRNQIAHGTKTHATKEEAKIAYDNVVDSIFHFIQAVGIELGQDTPN
jgi:hypothetical protein